MRALQTVFLSAVFAVLAAPVFMPAEAQDRRCDCTKTQRSAACEASVQHREGVVAVSSSSPACSMVVWTANGQPNVSLVKDGLDIFDWLGASAPDIQVEACEICLDNQLGIGGAETRLDVATIRPQTGIEFAPADDPALEAQPETGAGAGSVGAAVTAAASASCPGGSPAPELLTPAALEYPPEMEPYALDGTCNVLFDIAETGAAVNIRPACSHDGFVREAARAVAVVRFSPPYHCGELVPRNDVVYPLVFSFSANRTPVPSMAPIPDEAGR